MRRLVTRSSSASDDDVLQVFGEDVGERSYMCYHSILAAEPVTGNAGSTIQEPK
jgi:hypothetical protein